MDLIHNYKTLNSSKRGIRLIVLWPGKFEDAISCDLIYTSLNADPEYDALSYTWGIPTPVAAISINKRRFLVGSNLESALRHLRSEVARFNIWIDAVCINQSDMLEKGWQVQMMADIFRKAAIVRVWIGPYLPPKISMAEMNEMLLESSRLSISSDIKAEMSLVDWNDCDIWKLADLFGTNYLAPIWKDDGLAMSPKMHADAIRAWKTLQQMLEQSYWSRVWIQQEIVCADGSRVVLYYGKQHRSLLSFWRLTILCDLTRNKIPPGGYFSWLDPLVISFLRFKILCSRAFRYRLRREKQKITTTLMDTDNIWGLVGDQYYHQATNPLDKIYGLLGMIEPWAHGSFPVDYTSSTSSVYCKATKSLISQFKSLQIFANSEKIPSQYRDASLPSRCPDLSQYIDHTNPEPAHSPFVHITNIPHRLVAWQNGKDFQAAGNMSAICAFSPDTRILSAAGFRLANISAIHNGGLNLYGSHALIKSQLSEIKSIAFTSNFSQHSNPYPTPTETYKALWRTLCTNRPCNGDDHHGDFAPPFYAYAFSLWCDPDLVDKTLSTEDTTSFYTLINQLHIPHNPLNPNFGPPPPNLDKKGATEWLATFVAPFYKAALMATRRRRFCVSEVGFGLVGDDAVVGDLLCVLGGCGVPLVLRSVGGGYVLVGEAYLHGWMDGRAVERVGEMFDIR